MAIDNGQQVTEYDLALGELGKQYKYISQTYTNILSLGPRYNTKCKHSMLESVT